MGLFWDLIQHGQISEQSNRSDTIERRIQYLEFELSQTRELLNKLLHRLEEHFGDDINNDGSVGGS